MAVVRWRTNGCETMTASPIQKVVFYVGISLLFILFLYSLFIMGADGAPDATRVDSSGTDGETYRFVDPATNATCYVHEYNNQQSISCIRENERT